jgi:tetratricopeptide (TPR) repeat protein
LNQEAQAAFAKCFDRHPKDLECLKHEFTAVGRLGNISFDNKQFQDALANYQKSLDLALIYERMAPPGPEVGLHIAERHNHFGRTYFQMRDLDGALREFRLAQSALEPWANQPQASSTFLFELSSTYNNIGNVLTSQALARSDRGKMQEAIGYTERAAKLLEGLAASDPGNLFYWSNLAADYDNLEYLNGLVGNRGDQGAYARKRQQAVEKVNQQAAEKAKMANPGSVAQSPVAQSRPPQP